jgi:hypothetical protein
MATLLRLFLVGIVLLSVPTFASLTTLANYTGNVGYSSDGFGSLSQSGTISASVPAGSTVLAAYLYSASFYNPTAAGVGVVLNGTNLGAGTFVYNGAVCCDLGMTRWNVTSLLAPIINGGPGGIYNFMVEELDDSQDGEALVVVYSNPALGVSTVGILDGFSAAGGDSFTATFADPLDPTSPGFLAEMALGINFSCCGQRSNVSVNGTLITENAGNNDDGDEVADGSLITMGGFDDPYSPLLPSYSEDHERYNLSPYITMGDTSIVVRTNNPDNTDNIFLAVLQVSGEATITPTIPEPSTYLMLTSALGVLAYLKRRRR